MANHNSETSKLFKQRLKSQQVITDRQKEEIEALEEELATYRHAVISIHNKARLAGDFPSKQNLTDIIDICDMVL
jgi:hypothetical protein